MDPDWSVDGVMLRHLHIMSMHSRARQRRNAQTKQKVKAEDAQPAMVAATVEDDEEDLRQWLKDLYGDLDHGPEDVPKSTSPAFSSQHFSSSMEHIAVQRREAFGVPDGLGGGSLLSSLGADMSGEPKNRARTFNEGVSSGRFVRQVSDYTSPILTPAGPFIQTPTWTSADSGEFVGPAKGNSPLYVQSSARRWARDHCDESALPPHLTDRGMRLPRNSDW